MVRMRLYINAEFMMGEDKEIMDEYTLRNVLQLPDSDIEIIKQLPSNANKLNSHIVTCNFVGLTLDKIHRELYLRSVV